MQTQRILKSKINTALLVIAVIAILCVFLPWAHGKGSVSYSGGGYSGGGSARTAGVSGISFGAGLGAFVFCAAYAYLLWKKRTAPRMLFVLLPWIIFLSALSFISTMSNASSYASSNVGAYGGSARGSLEPEAGYFVFFLTSLALLIVSPFRTRKATALEIANENRELVRPEPIATASYSDPVEAIAKLKLMKEQGLITDQEFDQKKSEILARL